MSVESIIKTEDDFEALRDGYHDAEGLKVVENEHIESRRWVEVWRLVWSEDNGETFFAYYYELPASENQEGSESEFDAAGIYSVKAKTVMVVKYE